MAALPGSFGILLPMGRRTHVATRALTVALGFAVACGDDDGAPGNRDDAADRDDGAAGRDDAAPAIDALAADCQPVSGTDLLLEPLPGILNRPVFVTAPPGDSRLFVVEQAGLIRVFKDGALLPDPFLDLTAVVEATGNEQGLLGLAFHPGWAENRRFFVFYTAGGGAPYFDRVAEFAISERDPDRADPDSEQLVIETADPHPTHNAGMIAFGPDDMLYVGFGDGGGPGDPGDDAQDPTNLLGEMLRIDVDGDRPYEIPRDNPFADGAGGTRPEIWLSGLRNPWRWSFDRTTDELYIGDVGQQEVEEVTLIPAGQSGLNLGWNRVEGDTCYTDPDCENGDYLAPIATYRHTDEEPCAAVIGGYVYRGGCYPDLVGTYFYADACTARVFTLRVEDGVLVDGPTDVTADIDPEQRLVKLTSFGQDATGELYLLDRGRGGCSTSPHDPREDLCSIARPADSSSPAFWPSPPAEATTTTTAVTTRVTTAAAGATATAAAATTPTRRSTPAPRSAAPTSPSSQSPPASNNPCSSPPRRATPACSSSRRRAAFES